MSRAPIEAAILELLARRSAGATICPSEAAKRVAPGAWREWMDMVRETAGAMAREGRLLILQRGTVLDPRQPLRGAIRLKRPPDNPPHDG